MLPFYRIPWALPTFVLVLLVFFSLLPWRRKKLFARGLSSPRRRELGLLLLLAYLCILFTLTFDLDGIWANLYYGGGLPNFRFFSGGVSLSLLPQVNNSWEFFMLLGNLLFFLPLGFLVPLLFPRGRWHFTLLCGAGLSLFIECVQRVIGRSFDLSDILLNALGALVGFLLFLLLRRVASRFVSRFGPQPLPMKEDIAAPC